MPTVSRTIVKTASDTPGIDVAAGITLDLLTSAGIFATGTGASYGISALSATHLNLYGDVVLIGPHWVVRFEC